MILCDAANISRMNISRITYCSNRARFTFRASKKSRLRPMCGTHLRAWLRRFPKAVVTAAGIKR